MERLRHILIKSRTTEEEFVKWFKPIVPLEFDGKTLRPVSYTHRETPKSGDNNLSEKGVRERMRITNADTGCE